MFRKKKTRRISSSRRRAKFETLEHRLLLAADWQNPINEFDVNGSDGPVAITPLDAIFVINELSVPTVSHPVTRALPALGAHDADPAFYPDVDGNGVVTPLDALLVIDQLSRNMADIAVSSLNAPDLFMAGSRAALSHGVEHDTLVNTVTRKTQSYPDVAARSSGDVVIVWQSHDQDGSSWGVFAQRYSANGFKIGDEIAVNSTTHRSQRDPAVAVDDEGNFVVIWNSKSQDGSSWGVYGQLFNSLGEAIGAEFLVNQTTRRAQALADIAFLSDGQFVVSWEGRGEGDKDGVFVRRFSLDDNGVAPVTDETLVNTTTRSDQENSSIAALPDGAFIVAWDGRGPDDKSGIYIRRMGGDFELEEIRVNDETSHVQRRPSVSVGSDGQFVVAWQQSRDNGTGRGIKAQRFDNSGNPIGNAILVNQTQQSRQKGATAAFLADGSFSISWYGRGDGDRHGVFTRTFAADGNPMDDEQLVNFHIQSDQGRPAATAVNNGYVVTWRGRGADDRRGVFARFFDTEVQGPFRLDPIGNQTVNEESLLTVQVNVVDTDGQADNVTYSLDTAPSSAAIDPNSGEFTWTPAEADGPGTFDVAVTATEGDFADSRSFTITVNEVNLAPTLGMIDDQSISSEAPFSLTASATDPDLPANALTYAATLDDGNPLPNWLTFDATTQTFSGTPSDADAGTEAVRVTVTDDSGLSDDQVFSITVIAGPFRLEPIADQTVDEGTAVSLIASVVDTDVQADNVTFSLDVAPAGAEIDPVTGAFTWTPTEADGPGTVDVTVKATEGDFSDSQSFIITVNEVNLDPVLAEIADQTVAVDTLFSIGVVAIDPDLPANILTYEVTLDDATPLPDWLSFDSGSLVLSGTPSDADAGTIDVRATVTDAAGGSDFELFSITVTVNLPPQLVEAIPDQTAKQDAAYTFDIAPFFNEPDGDTLSFDAIVVGGGNLPSWLSFDPVMGVFSGTPTSEFANTTTSIEVTAADPDQATTNDTFDLRVVPNLAPVVSGGVDDTEQYKQVFRITAGASDGSIVGTVAATDPNPGDTLSFEITSGNDVGTFAIDTATGTITVASAASLQDGNEDALTVEVSDGEASVTADITIYTTSEAVAVAYTLKAFDSAGNPIVQVSPGQEFELRLFVQDRRETHRGTFSAYADITYPVPLVSVNGPIAHSSTYGAGLSGNTDTAGRLDEAGGTDGTSEFGPDPIEVEVLRLSFVVGNDVAAGTVLHFATNEAEDQVQHLTLLFGEDAAVAAQRKDFGTLSLAVADEP